MDQTTSAIFSFVIFGAVFYFLLIRPQQKHAKARKEMLEKLAVNDKVVTIGGMHGVVTQIGDETLTLKIADDVKVVFSKTAIASVEQK